MFRDVASSPDMFEISLFWYQDTLCFAFRQRVLVIFVPGIWAHFLYIHGSANFQKSKFFLKSMASSLVIYMAECGSRSRYLFKKCRRLERMNTCLIHDCKDACQRQWGYNRRHRIETGWGGGSARYCKATGHVRCRDLWEIAWKRTD